MSFLTEPSRVHFKEVLEYLETLEIPYRINNALISNKKMCSQTVFEIRDLDTDKVVAAGLRYNSVPKKIGFKRDMGAVGITILLPKAKDAKKSQPKSVKSPKVYFMQLGFDAKLKSLNVIEMLRRSKIPLAQSLGRDKLGGQVQTAENMNIPYTIIMGQKEAMENSVIVREMATRSQDTVKIENLPEYLKKMK
jgi:histidyl-tRNA synthetase